MKFELLSQMAIRAIVDEYYRDAILSFTGSLERLYEFFVMAAWRRRGIDTALSKVVWNRVANSSERQLGAFSAVYLLETGEAPTLLSQTKTGFRNAVIHKGRFPEREETIGFGQAVLECAMPVLKLLRSTRYSDAVAELVVEQLSDRSQQPLRLGVQPATAWISTFLSLTRADEQNVEAAVSQAQAEPEFNQGVREAHDLGAMVGIVRNSKSGASSPEGSISTSDAEGCT